MTLKTYNLTLICVMKAITWDLAFFGSHFPKNSQYLANGESDQKSVTNKKDAHFNSLYEVCHQI